MEQQCGQLSHGREKESGRGQAYGHVFSEFQTQEMEVKEAQHTIYTPFIRVWYTLASRLLSGHTGFFQTIFNKESPIWKPYVILEAVPCIHVTFIPYLFFKHLKKLFYVCDYFNRGQTKAPKNWSDRQCGSPCGCWESNLRKKIVLVTAVPSFRHCSPCTLSTFCSTPQCGRD